MRVKTRIDDNVIDCMLVNPCHELPVFFIVFGYGVAIVKQGMARQSYDINFVLEDSVFPAMSIEGYDNDPVSEFRKRLSEILGIGFNSSHAWRIKGRKDTDGARRGQR